MQNDHENKNSSIFKITLNLTAVCLVSGIIIAIVYYLTLATIERRQLEIRNSTMKNLVPNADNFIPAEKKTDWFKAVKKGELIAYIVPSESKGYGGIIKLLTAITPDGKVLNFSILDSKETPGLGDRASKEPFRSQFIGKSAENMIVTKDPGNKNDIQAISGATITSRAVTLGVKKAIIQINDFLQKAK